MNTLTTLKQTGLSNKEAKVYLANLELGSASISHIAKRAGLKRPTVYLVMIELIKKGFIVKILKGKRTFYRTENPEKLVTDLRSKLVKLEKAAPALKSLFQNPPQKAKVRFYEGRKEIFKVYWEAATTSKSRMISCFSYKNFSRLSRSQELMKKLIKAVQKNKAKLDDLVEDSEQAREYAKMKTRLNLGKTKFLPKSFAIKTDNFVYDNKVVMISFSSMTATVIENKDIAETQRNFLKFMWKNL